jgi:hypothetical protein
MRGPDGGATSWWRVPEPSAIKLANKKYLSLLWIPLYISSGIPKSNWGGQWEDMEVFAMCRLLLVSFFIYLTGICLAGENPVDGKFLPDGNWIARNQNSTIQNPSPIISNPVETYTEWGIDKRLSYFDFPNSNNSEIAAAGNHIYVAWWYVLSNILYLAQSDDAGYSWYSSQFTDDSTSSPGLPQLCASDSNVYVTFSGYRPYQGIYVKLSHNYGQTWQVKRLYYTARNLGEAPVIVSARNWVYVVAVVEVDFVPPQDWDLWLFRSSNCGNSWPDTFFVSDTTSGGIGPDLALNNTGYDHSPDLHLIRQVGLVGNNTQEIVYEGSTDGGETWYGPVIVSDNDTIHSQWPQIAAWGDSNIAVTWMDYRYSPYQWSGDAFFTKSTNNGNSWSEPICITESHLISSSDIYGVGDTVVLTYDDARLGFAAIFANVSYDGGNTWEGEQRVSDSDYYSGTPSVAIASQAAHESWSDSRISPEYRYFEIYYDRGVINTGVDTKPNFIPNDFSLSAYPNPFNSATTITLTGAEQAEIGIYDITGRLITTLHTFGGQALWDASAYSSGVYFARLAGEKASTIKLILLR